MTATSSPSFSNKNEQGVSVVVCCYNSENRISRTLQCIADQRVHGFPWEVIVVDNASQDNTWQIAQTSWEENDKSIPFRIVYEEQAGLMNAREKGMAEANYDIICFVDDDNRLDQDYIQIAYNIMSNDRQIAVVGGVGEPDFESDEPPRWLPAFKHAFATGKQADQSGDLSRTKQFVYGAGIVIRSSYWEQVKEANFKSMLLGRKGEELMSGEEVEMCHAFLYMGCKIWYDERLHFYHLIPSKRLKWQFIRDHHKGIGQTLPIVHAYNFFQNHDFLPHHYLRLPLWLDRAIHTLNIINDNKKGIWYLLKMNDEGSREAINVLMYWEELKMLVQYGKKLEDIYEEIYYLKKRLRESE